MLIHARPASACQDTTRRTGAINLAIPSVAVFEQLDEQLRMDDIDNLV